jgi:hypothetical protein
LLLATVLLPVGAKRPAARIAAVALLLGVTLYLLPAFTEELAEQLDHLAKEKDRDGANAFSYRDRLGVYGLNLVMGAGGYVVGFPEVADETLALIWPGDPLRHWGSDFAMASPKVRTAIREMVKGIPTTAGSDAVLPSRSVDWSGYGFSTDAMRVALAVNCPFLLDGTGKRAAGSSGPWTLELEGTARIAYPRRGFIPLGVRRNGKPWGLDEGIFWVLQERGWLHPYTAMWRWSVRSDNPRLQEATTVDRSWRERAFEAVWDLVQ